MSALKLKYFYVDLKRNFNVDLNNYTWLLIAKQGSQKGPPQIIETRFIKCEM